MFITFKVGNVKFIHSIQKYIVGAYEVLDTVLGFKETVVNKTFKKNPACAFIFNWWVKLNKTKEVK